MREYNVEVDGKLIHVTEEGDGRFEVTIPGGLKQECDPLTGQCSFGTPFNGCPCEPWNCPERVEQWAKKYDAEIEKLYNIAPEQRNLSFLKARLAQRCATNHSTRVNPKLTEEEARVITRVKERARKQNRLKERLKGSVKIYGAKGK